MVKELQVRSTQIPLFTPETEWVMPDELKDLRGAKRNSNRLRN